jgi:hypothetical protein
MPARGYTVIASPFHSQNYRLRKYGFHLFMNLPVKFVLFCAVCALVGYVTVILARSPNRVGPGVNNSRGTFETDRRFLDVLFQELNKEDRPGWEWNLPPIRKTSSVGTVESCPQSVPRAVLVVNSEIIRRGELVVHSGTVKHKRQNITP